MNLYPSRRRWKPRLEPHLVTPLVWTQINHEGWRRSCAEWLIQSSCIHIRMKPNCYWRSLLWLLVIEIIRTQGHQNRSELLHKNISLVRSKMRHDCYGQVVPILKQFSRTHIMGNGGTVLPFLTLTLDWVEVSTSRPGPYPPKCPRHHLDRSLGMGTVEHRKSLAPAGNRTPAVHPVARHSLD
jgi:hypothetical protein